MVESALQTPCPGTWSNSGLMEVLPLCKISSEQVNNVEGNSVPVTSIICAFYDILQCDCLMSIMFALHCQFVILEKLMPLDLSADHTTEFSNAVGQQSQTPN